MDTNREAGASSCYCLKVRRANGIVAKFYDSLMAPSGVTVRQYSLLLHISRTEGISVRQLADQTGLDRSTLARSLKPLFHRELIQDAKPAGTRDSRLRLTERGTAVLSEAARLWGEAQGRFAEALGPEGLQKLEDVLQTLDTLL